MQQHLNAGAVVRLDQAASVQFKQHPFNFRVIRVHPSDTADRDGWAWLDGYQLDDQGDAVERRSVFVRMNGLNARR